MQGRRAERSPAELKRSAAVGGEAPVWKNQSPSGDVCTGALEGRGRQVAERRMDSATIVESLNVVKDAGAGLGTSPVLLVVDELGLQGVEEALLDRVVVAVALAAHAGDNAMGVEHDAEFGRCVLDAAVGVMDQASSRPALVDGH